ncbi:hypothetical protein BDZ90DRAFT_262431 [Jaminaea rosea]|uniref:Uncharacterized protein n=1 Tax=Jaminaea rosea TaxID=1569628 RepID=A0A316UN89_9BASI|nr:hypothetical protein BDZ90DRAFT_262431 [Jaminaea rosea]PWN25383.1 hypothetical protein BDZ90DRAFT_262431 [Jaminaea rosea]
MRKGGALGRGALTLKIRLSSAHQRRPQPSPLEVFLGRLVVEAGASVRLPGYHGMSSNVRARIPRAPRRFEDLAPTTSYINWVGSVVPVDILLRANKDVPFIPGPCTIDVPLIACSQSSAPVGDALAAVFREQEYDPPINAGRTRMQEMCRWNGELLLGRIRLSPNRLEDQSMWDRRLRASIKVKSIVLVFGHLGMPATLVLGDKKTAMDRIIDRILRKGASYDVAALHKRMQGGHESQSRYLDRRFTPSLPNMHITLEGTSTVKLDGNGYAL